MLFVITALDRPGALDQRLKVRPRHLEYLQDRASQIKVGGALLDQHDQPMGSMLVIEAESAAAAEAFAADDPFSREGVFEQITVRPYRAVLGAWAG